MSCWFYFTHKHFLEAVLSSFSWSCNKKVSCGFRRKTKPYSSSRTRVLDICEATAPFPSPFQYKEAGETRRSQPPVTSRVGVLFTTSITRKPQPGDYKVRLHKLFHSLSEADKERFRGEKSNSRPTASTGGLFYFSIQSRTTFHF